MSGDAILLHAGSPSASGGEVPYAEEMRRSLFLSLFVIVAELGVSSTAAAQAPPPYAPPPGYPPPGYGGYPPPGYWPQGYPPGYAPPGYAPYAPPLSVPPPPPRMDPDHPPPGYHTESRARRGMVLGGGLMLGIGYLISAGVGAAGITDHNRGLVPMLVPVAGPFITLETSHVFEGTRDQAATVGKVFGAMGLILDGVLQVGGLSMVVVGLAAPKQTVVRDRDEEPRAAPTVAIGPAGASACWRF